MVFVVFQDILVDFVLVEDHSNFHILLVALQPLFYISLLQFLLYLQFQDLFLPLHLLLLSQFLSLFFILSLFDLADVFLDLRVIGLFLVAVHSLLDHVTLLQAQAVLLEEFPFIF